MRHAVLYIVFTLLFSAPGCLADEKGAPVTAEFNRSMEEGVAAYRHHDFKTAEQHYWNAYAKAEKNLHLQDEALNNLSILYEASKSAPSNPDHASVFTRWQSAKAEQEKTIQQQLAKQKPEHVQKQAAAPDAYPEIGGQTAYELLKFCKQNYDSVCAERVPGYHHSSDFHGNVFQVQPGLYLVSTSCKAMLSTGLSDTEATVWVSFRIAHAKGKLVVVSREVSVMEIDGKSHHATASTSERDHESIADKAKKDADRQYERQQQEESERRRAQQEADQRAYEAAEAQRRRNETAGQGTSYWSHAK